MNDSVNNGGPAFPVDRLHGTASGMTLRDYFAAKAISSGGNPFSCYDFDLSAEWAYKLADAMLKARGES